MRMPIRFVFEHEPTLDAWLPVPIDLQAMAGTKLEQVLEHGALARNEARAEVLCERRGPQPPRKTRGNQHALGLDREKQPLFVAAPVERAHACAVARVGQARPVRHREHERTAHLGHAIRASLAPAHRNVCERAARKVGAGEVPRECDYELAVHVKASAAEPRCQVRPRRPHGERHVLALVHDVCATTPVRQRLRHARTQRRVGITSEAE
jgi:hypothetical protein